MSDKTLRFLVAAIIAMLLVYQIGIIISSVFGMAWGVISSAVVAAVTFFSARLARAGGKSSLWFLLPTLLFTVVPIAMNIWNAATGTTSWFNRLSGLIPFILSFGAPIILLLLVYYELRKRTISH
jgi:hypothetical protein